ncbi:hypothetical protein Mal65_49420 [Crateriforma conspicua]|nr:hypothetical protein Mal65_49420 [Crateriforma conspicua]
MFLMTTSGVPGNPAGRESSPPVCPVCEFGFTDKAASIGTGFCKAISSCFLARTDQTVFVFLGPANYDDWASIEGIFVCPQPRNSKFSFHSQAIRCNQADGIRDAWRSGGDAGGWWPMPRDTRVQRWRGGNHGSECWNVGWF